MRATGWMFAAGGLAVLGLIMAVLWRHDADQMQKEALSQCEPGADSCCVASHISDDGECVHESLPDGAKCRDFKESFCELSCVCEGGVEQVEERDCDDGNPCTEDHCGYGSGVTWTGETSKSKAGCRSSPVSDGVRCGPDQDGECRQGLCVMSYGMVHLDFPLEMMPRK